MPISRCKACVFVSILIICISSVALYYILLNINARQRMPDFRTTTLTPAGKTIHIISPLPYLNMQLIQSRPTNCSSCCQSLAGTSVQIAVFGKTSLCDINLEFDDTTDETANGTVVTTSAYQNHAGLLNKFSFNYPTNWQGYRTYSKNESKDRVLILGMEITPKRGIVESPHSAVNETLCSADANQDGNVYSLYFNTEHNDPDCRFLLDVLGPYQEREKNYEDY